MLQKCHAPLRGADTLVGTVKNGEAHGLLHFPQNAAQIGLAHIQVFGCLGNGTHTLNLDHILQMFDIHKNPPPSGAFFDPG
jgi:hypothetical protein